MKGDLGRVRGLGIEKGLYVTMDWMMRVDMGFFCNIMDAWGAERG